MGIGFTVFIFLDEITILQINKQSESVGASILLEVVKQVKVLCVFLLEPVWFVVFVVFLIVIIPDGSIGVVGVVLDQLFLVCETEVPQILIDNDHIV